VTAPKTHDLYVWYTAEPPRKAVRIHVRNMAEALTVLAAIEATTAYETVNGIRREVAHHMGVRRFEAGVWEDVADWELDAVQDVLDAA
jgi:hypothetical protein